MSTREKTRARTSFHIWGRHPVESYLAGLTDRKDADPSVFTLHLIVDKAGKAPAQLRTAVELAKALGIVCRTHKSVEDEWPLGLDAEVKHQRICLRVPTLTTSPLHEVLSVVRDAKERSLKGCIGIVLDEIQDPQNFGAILRSASFFGVRFVVFGKDRQASLSSTVAKVSAGGIFTTLLCEVVNVSRALGQIRDAGCWTVGAVLDGSVELSAVPLDRPYVVVLGNEAKGVRPEVVRQCDYRVRIPGGSAAVDSLNVSVAAGVFGYALRVVDSASNGASASTNIVGDGENETP